MKRILFFSSIFFVLTTEAQMRRFSFQQPRMGSLFTLVMYGNDSIAANAAANAAFRLIDTLNDIYSDYLPKSELNRLCATAGDGNWHPVSPELYHIITTAHRAAGASEGSFDVTAGPLVRVWRRARLLKQMPSRQSIDSARTLCGYRLIEFDSLTQSIRLKQKGMQLDLGGIAKGETAQRVINRLRESGFPSALLDAGGDIVCGDAPPGVASWKVAVNRAGSEEVLPDQLHIQNKSVTTSGDLYQYIVLNGKRFSHIVDPRTGIALTNSRNVTVIADSGINADWLTKACSILPVKKAIRLISKYPGSDVQIAFMRKKRLVTYRSKRFTTYFQSQK